MELDTPPIDKNPHLVNDSKELNDLADHDSGVFARMKRSARYLSIDE